jgi:small Trp-rich protein
MWLLGIGLVLVVLKLAEIEPVAGWAWWVLLLPFAATVAWWVFADATGLTARREQQRWMERREKRRREAVGNLHPSKGASGTRIQRHDPTSDDRR